MYCKGYEDLLYLFYWHLIVTMNHQRYMSVPRSHYSADRAIFSPVPGSEGMLCDTETYFFSLPTLGLLKDSLLAIIWGRIFTSYSTLA